MIIYEAGTNIHVSGIINNLKKLTLFCLLGQGCQKMRWTHMIVILIRYFKIRSEVY